MIGKKPKSKNYINKKKKRKIYFLSNKAFSRTHILSPYLIPFNGAIPACNV